MFLQIETWTIISHCINRRTKYDEMLPYWLLTCMFSACFQLGGPEHVAQTWIFCEPWFFGGDKQNFGSTTIKLIVQVFSGQQFWVPMGSLGLVYFPAYIYHKNQGFMYKVDIPVPSIPWGIVQLWYNLDHFVGWKFLEHLIHEVRKKTEDTWTRSWPKPN